MKGELRWGRSTNIIEGTKKPARKPKVTILTCHEKERKWEFCFNQMFLFKQITLTEVITTTGCPQDLLPLDPGKYPVSGYCIILVIPTAQKLKWISETNVFHLMKKMEIFFIAYM